MKKFSIYSASKNIFFTNWIFFRDIGEEISSSRFVWLVTYQVYKGRWLSLFPKYSRCEREGESCHYFISRGSLWQPADWFLKTTLFPHTLKGFYCVSFKIIHFREAHHWKHCTCEELVWTFSFLSRHGKIYFRMSLLNFLIWSTPNEF